MESHEYTNETVRNSVDAAKQLMRSNRHKEALRAIEDIDPTSLSPYDKASYNLISIEGNISLGNYDVEGMLQETHEYFTSTGDQRGLATAKYLYARMHMALGDFFPAREQCFEAYLLFKRLDDYKWQGRALNRLSYISLSVGEMNSAVDYLEKCIDMYTDHNDSRNAISVSVNLAHLYLKMGRLADSARLYSEIEPQINSYDRRLIGIFHLMHAVSHVLKGDTNAGKRIMAMALPCLDDFRREQAIYFQYLGWISNLEGEFDEAVTALRQGLDIALEIAPESSLVSNIKRLLAEASIGLGDFATAKTYADEALAVAEKLNERVEMAGCYRVYAIIDAYAGNAEATRRWFDKALGMYSMIGARYELADTRFLAGVSGFYHDGERHALLYLAREYFASENVEQYVTKIDRELKESPPLKTRPAHENNVMPTIVCRNPAMVRLVDTARHVAPSNMSVLLTGPTGCGKDLLARYIHHHSGRAGRFISVNAAAIPDNMVESELFGYTRGAFTGAASTTSGWIEEAHNGTFYLNEIADSSPELQAKLLDVIENHRICRLGERQEREIDCRIIAATNHDLEKLIDNGSFRLDLYHRLNEIPLDLPPLSERSDDIKPLIEYFLKSEGVDMSGPNDMAAFNRLGAIFAERSWPGNVRELEIEVKRLILLSRKSVTRMLELSTINQRSKKDETLMALERAGWNRREAARALGVSESTVRHRIKTYKLIPHNKRGC